MTNGAEPAPPLAPSLLPLLLLLLLGSSHAAGCPGTPLYDGNLTCYYEGRLPPDRLEPCACTRLVLVGWTLHPRLGMVHPRFENLSFVESYKNRHPSLKALASLNVEGATPKLTPKDTTATFVRFLKEHPDLDGLELDVRTSVTAEDLSAHVALLEALRNALDEVRRTSVLAVAVAADPTVLRPSRNFTNLSRYADIVLLPPRDPTVDGATIAGPDFRVDLAIGLGLDPGKLVLGISALGHSLRHHQICTPAGPDISPLAQPEWNRTGGKPFAGPSQINDDDPLGIRVTSEFAILRGLAGVGVWTVDDACLAADAGGARQRRRRRQSAESLECTRQGYYRHPADCGRFYRCVRFDQFRADAAWVTFEYECPAGLVFDERHEVCAWPGTSAPCFGSDEIFPVPRGRFLCPGPGFHRDPENCRWFYFCSDLYGDGALFAFEFRCPYDLAFDEESVACQWRWVAEPPCGGGERRVSVGIHHGRAGPHSAAYAPLSLPAELAPFHDDDGPATATGRLFGGPSYRPYVSYAAAGPSAVAEAPSGTPPDVGSLSDRRPKRPADDGDGNDDSRPTTRAQAATHGEARLQADRGSVRFSAGSEAGTLGPDAARRQEDRARWSAVAPQPTRAPVTRNPPGRSPVQGAPLSSVAPTKIAAVESPSKELVGGRGSGNDSIGDGQPRVESATVASASSSERSVTTLDRDAETFPFDSQPSVDVTVNNEKPSALNGPLVIQKASLVSGAYGRSSPPLPTNNGQRLSAEVGIDDRPSTTPADAEVPGEQGRPPMLTDEGNRASSAEIGPNDGTPSWSPPPPVDYGRPSASLVASEGYEQPSTPLAPTDVGRSVVPPASIDLEGPSTLDGFGPRAFHRASLGSGDYGTSPASVPSSDDRLPGTGHGGAPSTIRDVEQVPGNYGTPSASVDKGNHGSLAELGTNDGKSFQNLGRLAPPSTNHGTPSILDGDGTHPASGSAERLATPGGHTGTSVGPFQDLRGPVASKDYDEPFATRLTEPGGRRDPTSFGRYGKPSASQTSNDHGAPFPSRVNIAHVGSQFTVDVAPELPSDDRRAPAEVLNGDGKPFTVKDYGRPSTPQVPNLGSGWPSNVVPHSSSDLGRSKEIVNRGWSTTSPAPGTSFREPSAVGTPTNLDLSSVTSGEHRKPTVIRESSRGSASESVVSSDFGLRSESSKSTASTDRGTPPTFEVLGNRLEPQPSSDISEGYGRSSTSKVTPVAGRVTLVESGDYGKLIDALAAIDLGSHSTTPGDYGTPPTLDGIRVLHQALPPSNNYGRPSTPRVLTRFSVESFNDRTATDAHASGNLGTRPTVAIESTSWPSRHYGKPFSTIAASSDREYEKTLTPDSTRDGGRRSSTLAFGRHVTPSVMEVHASPDGPSTASGHSGTAFRSSYSEASGNSAQQQSTGDFSLTRGKPPTTYGPRVLHQASLSVKDYGKPFTVVPSSHDQRPLVDSGRDGGPSTIQNFAGVRGDDGTLSASNSAMHRGSLSTPHGNGGRLTLALATGSLETFPTASEGSFSTIAPAHQASVESEKHIKPSGFPPDRGPWSLEFGHRERTTVATVSGDSKRPSTSSGNRGGFASTEASVDVLVFGSYGTPPTLNSASNIEHWPSTTPSSERGGFSATSGEDGGNFARSSLGQGHREGSSPLLDNGEKFEYPPQSLVSRKSVSSENHGKSSDVVGDRGRPRPPLDVPQDYEKPSTTGLPRDLGRSSATSLDYGWSSTTSDSGASVIRSWSDASPPSGERGKPFASHPSGDHGLLRRPSGDYKIPAMPRTLESWTWPSTEDESATWPSANAHLSSGDGGTPTGTIKDREWPWPSQDVSGDRGKPSASDTQWVVGRSSATSWNYGRSSLSSELPASSDDQDPSVGGGRPRATEASVDRGGPFGNDAKPPTSDSSGPFRKTTAPSADYRRPTPATQLSRNGEISSTTSGNYGRSSTSANSADHGKPLFADDGSVKPLTSTDGGRRLQTPASEDRGRSPVPLEDFERSTVTDTFVSPTTLPTPSFVPLTNISYETPSEASGDFGTLLLLDATERPSTDVFRVDGKPPAPDILPQLGRSSVTTGHSKESSSPASRTSKDLGTFGDRGRSSSTTTPIGQWSSVSGSQGEQPTSDSARDGRWPSEAFGPLATSSAVRDAGNLLRPSGISSDDFGRSPATPTYRDNGQSLPTAAFADDERPVGSPVSGDPARVPVVPAIDEVSSTAPTTREAFPSKSGRDHPVPTLDNALEALVGVHAPSDPRHTRPVVSTDHETPLRSRGGASTGDGADPKTIQAGSRVPGSSPPDSTTTLEVVGRQAVAEVGPVSCTRPGLFRHPDDCSRFYECYWDRWIRAFTLHFFDCPVRLAYDNTLTGCNWPAQGPPCPHGR